MEHIVSYGTDLFYIFVLDRFGASVLGAKYMLNKVRIGGLVCCMIIYNFISYNLYNSRTGILCAGIIWHFFIFYIFYNGDLKSKAAVVFFIEIANMISEILLYMMFMLFNIKDIDMNNMSSKYALVGSAVSKLAVFVIVKLYILIYRIAVKKQIGALGQMVKISLYDWLETVTIPGASMSVLMYMVSDINVSFNWTCICLALLAINIISYDQYNRLRVNIVNVDFFHGIKESYNILKRYVRVLSEKWQEMRNFRHDIKKNYMLEMMYLERGELEKLKLHYNKISGMKIFCRHETGNWLFDMIIDQIRTKIEAYKIEFVYDINVPVDISFDDYRINRMLGNILDNAIEASVQCPENNRWMNLVIRIHGNNMYIECANSCIRAENKKMFMGEYKTTKKDNEKHGCGIKIIKQIADSYQGNVKIEHDNKKFVMKVILYNAIE